MDLSHPINPEDPGQGPLTKAFNMVVHRTVTTTNRWKTVLYAVCDLVYVSFPIMFVWKLHMPLHRKIGLAILLGLSIITFAAAFAKALVVALALSGHFVMIGPNFKGLYFYISTIAQSLVTIIGCVPTMKPITRLQFPTFCAIGESIASLITRKSDRSKKGSLSGGSSHHDGIKFRPHQRISDDEFLLPGNGVEHFHSVQGSKSSHSLRNNDHIRRVDELEITYAR